MIVRGRLRWAVAAVALAVLWSMPQAQAITSTSAGRLAAEDDGPLCQAKIIAPPPGFVEPNGLPALTPCTTAKKADGTSITPTGTNWTGVSTVGMQKAPHLAQWVKIPPAISIAVVPIHSTIYGPDLPPGVTNFQDFLARVWFVSDDRRRAGEMPPFRVTSLAFGAIPVQVTVNITQPRDAQGGVVPLAVNQRSSNYSTLPTQGFSDATGTGQVEVRLSDASVDGVPLDLGNGCHTRSLAQLTLKGQGYGHGQPRPTADPAVTYNAALGGRLDGTLDIPPFTGCTSRSGDDVSRLLTNLISGTGNPIRIQQSVSSTSCYPKFDAATCTRTLVDIPYPAAGSSTP